MAYAKEEGQAVIKEGQEGSEEEGREKEGKGKKGCTKANFGFYPNS